MAEEVVEFCADYLSSVDAVGIPSSVSIYEINRPLSSVISQRISQEEWDQAHLYVLRNNNEVEPFTEKHMSYLRVTYPIKACSRKWLQDEHNRKFIGWLRESVANALNHTKANISDTLKWIVHGPRIKVLKYSAYMVDGVCYHTKQREQYKIIEYQSWPKQCKFRVPRIKIQSC